MPDLVDAARAAERSGFTGMALMDHFAPPLAESHDMWEAMAAAAWLLSATERLKVSHLVLCDAFRHPAMLGAPGRHARSCVGWPVRARHRMGLGTGGVRSVRGVPRVRVEAHRVVQGIARGHTRVVDRRDRRLRGRVPHAHRSAATAHTTHERADHHRRFGRTDLASGGQARRLVEPADLRARQVGRTATTRRRRRRTR